MALYRHVLANVLERCNPNLRGRETDKYHFGLTILHSVAASREHMTAGERVAFATMLLDAGARLDVRDNLLESTPLGWACRWGRIELVKLLLERGADPLEADAEPWATRAHGRRKWATTPCSLFCRNTNYRNRLEEFTTETRRTHSCNSWQCFGP